MMLLDTSGLLCLFHRAEAAHEVARQLFESTDWSLTHGYVLAEFVALGTARGVGRREILAAVDTLLAIPYIEIVWIDEALHRRAMAFLHQRADKTYSLADAVSFLLMSDRNLREALTTDHHFEQAGFIRLLRP
ncbi:MAG: PIN domain-containing protein [Isosphaeraceae bacterium]